MAETVFYIITVLVIEILLILYVSGLVPNLGLILLFLFLGLILFFLLALFWALGPGRERHLKNLYIIGGDDSFWSIRIMNRREGIIIYGRI